MRRGWFTGLGVAAATLSACMSGCSARSAGSQDTKIDQSSICEVHDWKADASAAVCHAQQKIVFLPEQWGNEQLPILFAAVNCDMRYGIALTNGGVACIYAGPLAPSRPAATTSTNAPSGG